jgi:hypothetical protein
MQRYKLEFPYQIIFAKALSSVIDPVNKFPSISVLFQLYVFCQNIGNVPVSYLLGHVFCNEDSHIALYGKCFP